MVALPPLASVGGTGTHSRHPFAAFAQSGCTPSQNQIIQDCLFLGRAQFEQTAVQSYLAWHGLPSTDAALVYQYGGSNLRNTIRGYMMDMLWADANTDPSQLDALQSNAHAWLQGKVQAEEVKYWAAAANEYKLSFADKCNYKLDPDVATQQSLQYDPTQWCYPNFGNYFLTPEVPTFDYFLAVAWKKTYGSLIAGSTADSSVLLGMQQQAPNQAALFALPGSLAAGVAAGGAVALSINVIDPYLSAHFTAAGYKEIVTEAAQRAADATKFVARSLSAVNQVIDDVAEFVTGASVVDVATEVPFLA